MASKRDDTFRRVFEKLEPKVLEEKLSQWLPQIMGSYQFTMKVHAHVG